MKLIDNLTDLLGEDLKDHLEAGSKVSIAAACFSIYAFQELKKQLQDIDELRFLFTSPTFTTEKADKEKREFYIPKLTRERSLYGTEFEVRLRNELNQKAIVKECADWIREKVTFKSNTKSTNIQSEMLIDNDDNCYSYSPINGFTTADLGCERGNNEPALITRMKRPYSDRFMKLFDELWKNEEKLQDVTETVIDNITSAYVENSPEYIYYITLYNIFNEFLSDISEDVLPNEATGFQDSAIWGKLYNFQKDAALAIINKLEQYNGCILADSVGLGKTFTALAVIKYYENRNKSVLVLCPKKLAENWNTYKDNYVNNPIAADRLNYDVLFHTDLSRNGGFSNGLDLNRLNWGNYDLVVIDESHNFRNGGSGNNEDKENRYERLMNRVMKNGVKTKVLMLSATPVNNRFNDLKNQLALAYEGDADQLNPKLKTNKDIDEIFKRAQAVFNKWSKQPEADRTTKSLTEQLDFDFFELLDSVTIARSRKHIRNYYDTSDIGSFPKRLLPVSLRPKLTNLQGAINFREIYEQLEALNLNVYMPSAYIFPSAMSKYQPDSDDPESNLNQFGREKGIRSLMATNLLKRLESSVHSFELTLRRVKNYIDDNLKELDAYEKNRQEYQVNEIDVTDDLDDDELNTGYTVGRNNPIDPKDMDIISWRRDLEADSQTLELLISMVEDITPEYDAKLQKLLELIDEKLKNPINEGNKKVLVFSAFADTAQYLYNEAAPIIKEKYGLNTGMITGSVEGRTTIKGLKATLNNVLTCFSPVSKEKEILMPGNNDEIDILIATDCISEG